MKDTIAPDRLVYGLPDGEDRPRANALLEEVYATAISKDTPSIITDYVTAELVKVSANAFLATKISFINAMAEIAEVTGADVTALADAMGHDNRIGRRFLNAGIGFGGGCLPKDIRAFTARAEELGRGESVAFLKEVDSINLRRRERMVELVVESLGGQAYKKKVAVLGLAFKPHSDDVRDSPALDVAVRLHGLGAHVIATDPQAIPNSIRSIHSWVSPPIPMMRCTRRTPWHSSRSGTSIVRSTRWKSVNLSGDGPTINLTSGSFWTFVSCQQVDRDNLHGPKRTCRLLNLTSC